MSENNIRFNFRGKDFWISKKQIITFDDFFLKHLINDTIEDGIDVLEIDEDLNYARTIFNSMEQKRLVLDNNVNIYGIEYLADKWCCPEWLMKEIKKITDQDLLIEMLKDSLLNTFQCKLCSIGFKLTENKIDSCVYHSGYENPHTLTWTCCGKTFRNLDPNTQHCQVIHGCVSGYHIPDINVSTLNMHLDLYKKLCNENNKGNESKRIKTVLL